MISILAQCKLNCQIEGSSYYYASKMVKASNEGACSLLRRQKKATWVEKVQKTTSLISKNIRAGSKRRRKRYLRAHYGILM